MDFVVGQETRLPSAAKGREDISWKEEEERVKNTIFTNVTKDRFSISFTSQQAQ